MHFLLYAFWYLKMEVFSLNMQSDCRRLRFICCIHLPTPILCRAVAHRQCAACEMAPFQPVLSQLKVLWLPSSCPVYLTCLYFQSLADLQAILRVPTYTQLKILCTGSKSLLAKVLLPYFVKWILSLSSSSLKRDPWLGKPKHSLQHWLQSSLLIFNMHPHLSRLFPSMRSSCGLSCSLHFLSNLYINSCSSYSH